MEIEEELMEYKDTICEYYNLTDKEESMIDSCQSIDACNRILKKWGLKKLNNL